MPKTVIRGKQIGLNEIDNTNIKEDAASLTKISLGKLYATSTGIGIGANPPSFPGHIRVLNSGIETTALALVNHATTTGTGVVLRMTNSTDPLAAHYRSEIASIRTDSPGTGAHDMILRVSNGSSMQDRITIKSAGNVGINVTSPNEALEVNGFVRSSSGYKVGTNTVIDSSRRYIAPSGQTGTGFGINMNNSNIIGINHMIIEDPGEGEGLEWKGTAAGWTIDVSPEDRSNTDGNLNLYGTSDNIVLWRPTKLKGTGSNLIVEGTGTSSIAGDLTISGALSVTGDISTNGEVLAGGGNGGTPSYSFASDTDTGMYLSGSNSLAFSAGGSARFLISGSSYIRSYTRHRFADGTEASPGLNFSSDADTGIWRPGADIIGFAAGGVDIMRVTKDAVGGDNVSVSGDISWTGTLTGGTVPWARLSNHPTINFKAGNNISATGLSTITLNQNNEVTINTVDDPEFDTSVTTPLLKNTGNISIAASGANYISLSTNGTERIRILSGGNVGVGTSSPSQKLDVNGDIRISERIYSNSAIGFYTDANGAQNVKVGSLVISSSYAHSIPGNGLYVHGNTGMGTQTPGEKLHVEGYVRSSSGYKVATTEVLDSSRNLKNLNSIAIGTTTIVDSSRNLTNIGTISSGAITSTSTITASGKITGSSFETTGSITAKNIKATRLTITAGNKTATWTHSYGSNNYAVSHIAESPVRHIYIDSSTTNAVTISLDDIHDENVVVHLTLIGW